MSAARLALRGLLVFGALALVLVLALLTVWTQIPALARGPGARLASHLLQRPVSIEGVKLEPFALAVHVQGLRIGEVGGGAGTFASLERFDLALAPESLRQGYPVIDSVTLQHPVIHLARDPQGHLNIDDLLEHFLKAPAHGPTPALVIRKLLVRDGNVDWSDAVSHRQHALTGLQFELPFFSTRSVDAAAAIEPRLFGYVDGHLLVLYGAARDERGQEDLAAHFEVEDLALRDYVDLIPFPQAFELRDGHFDARMDVHLHVRPGRLPALQLAGQFTLRKLDLRESAAATVPLLSLDQIAIPVSAFDLDQRRLHLGRITVRGFTASARRDASGDLDWVRLLRRMQAASGAAAPATAGLEGSAGVKAPAPAAAAADAAASSATAGSRSGSALEALVIDGVDFEQGRAAWTDDAPGSRVSFALRDAQLVLGPLQWPAPATIGFSLRLSGDHHEHADLGGLLYTPGPRIDAEVRLEHIDPGRFAPYFAGRLPVQIETSPFSTQAHLEGGLDAEGAYARLSGLQFQLPVLTVRQGNDRLPLLAMRDLTIEGLEGDSRASLARVHRIRWSSLHSRVQISSAEATLEQLSADWKRGQYQIGALAVAELGLPEHGHASILRGETLQIDLPARRYTLQSLAGAQLALPTGLRAEAIRLADASADLDAGRYRIGVLNAAGLAAPGANRIGGITLSAADADLAQGRVTFASLSASELSLGGRFDFPWLEAAGAHIDYGRQRLMLDALRARGARLRLLREASGALSSGSLREALKAIPELGKAAASRTESAPVQPGGRFAAWQGSLGDLQLEDWAGSFRDEALRRPGELRWTALGLHLQHLSTLITQTAQLDFQTRLNDSAQISLRGDLSAEPLDARLKLALTGLRLPELLPWIPLRLPVVLNSGVLNAQGDLQVSGTRVAPALLWDGEARLADVALLDRKSGDPLLAWDVIEARGVHFNSRPLDAALAALTLRGLHAQIELQEDGSFNFSRLASATAEPAATNTALPAAAARAATAPPAANTSTPAATALPPAAARAPAAGRPPSTTTRAPGNAPGAAEAAQPDGVPGSLPGFPLSIARIDLQDSSVDFSDRYVHPAYSTQLSGLAGSVTGLGNQSGTAGRVELDGKLAGGASVRVTGAMNPLLRPPYLDLKAVVRDFELGPLSSYSTRFTGYPIVRGKLSFDVAYRLKEGQITAQNKLTLDQLTLGPPQEVPGMKQLPMDLAVNLLKDSDGVIQVDLPIDGTMSDPKFNLGSIIAQLVTRAVERAITAPLRWLGGLFGGEHAESFGWVGFAPGSDALDATAQDKLRRLAQALGEKRGLRLDIAARIDPELDAAGLAESLFQGKLRTQKVRQRIRAGQPVGAAGALVWTPAEVPGLLAAAWKQEYPGRPVPTDPAALERELRSTIHVGADALADLGERRARTTQNWLTGPGGIDPARVFVLGAESAPASGSSASPAPPLGRVDFTLR